MCRTKNVIITESGIERKTATVARDAAQEHQDHHSGEKNSDAAFAQHSGDRFFHEHRLVEYDVGLQLRRECRAGL